MSSSLKVATTYKKLVTDISRLYDKARKSQVEFYWQTGRRIVEVEQEGNKRAPWHENLLESLSNDLTQKFGKGFSINNLERMRLIYLRYSKSPPAGILDWSHHIELMPVKSKTLRERLERKVIQKGLHSKELRKLVQYEIAREQISKNHELPEPLEPRQGRLYAYRILDPKTIPGGEAAPLLIDLGFSCYRDLDDVTSKRFKPNDLVMSVKIKDEYSLALKSELKPADLFTFQATIEKVVDADTLRVVVDLGFNTRTRQYLRLRGINTPETDSAEGKKASDFVKTRIKAASQIILTSSKSDKYDRYLADIFFTDSQGRQIYLNNLLLESGHAVRMGT